MLGGIAGLSGAVSKTGGGALGTGPPWHDRPTLTIGVYETTGPPKWEYDGDP